MGVAQGTGLPEDSGRRDAQHNRARVRRQIQDALRERIGEEDIIAAGPEKRIRVPIRSDRRYRFILDRGRRAGGGAAGSQPGTDPGEEAYEVWLDMEEVEETLFESLDLPRLKPKREVAADATDVVFDDIAKQGPLLDKRATLRENLRRAARQGDEEADWDRDDLRYLTWDEEPRPKTQAVVLLMMDVSGSMSAEHKRIARLFFYWTVRFLRRRYTHVEVRFIAHTTEAREVTEQQFFNRVESGGTLVSSAYERARAIQRERYPASDWNVYVLHASDGENFFPDNERVLDLIGGLMDVCSLIGYLQIAARPPGHFGASSQGKLAAHLARRPIEGLVVAEVADDHDIWPALQRFFAREDVEEAVVA
jgi:sporulation protein YhbH